MTPDDLDLFNPVNPLIPMERFAQALNDHMKSPAFNDESRVEDVRGTALVGSWFLGPKAENEELLLSLLTSALQTHSKERRAYYPDDPSFVTSKIKKSTNYKYSVDNIKNQHAVMLRKLTGSVPFYSYRYQAHQVWDPSLVAVAGYFAAMLYNQNNVAAEASPVTTVFDIDVGDDFAKLLGYPMPSESENGPDTIRPWGHITCDGSVANLEGMWAARNLKFYSVALAAALKHEPELTAARNITIPLLDGSRAVLADLDTWTLVNLPIDAALAVSTRIREDYKIPGADIDGALDRHSLQTLGFDRFRESYLKDLGNTGVIIGPSTKHYSWPKNAAILGIGKGNYLDVSVDLDARMDLAALRAHLDECLANKRPVIQVVSVNGSTELGSVDPLEEIVAMREEYRKAGLEFWIHVDAAWGGYFASMLRKPAGGMRGEYTHPADSPELSLAPYVRKQFEAMKLTDSATVDPHKTGFAPYPAGGICYRNSAMRNLVSFTSPVIFHGAADPTIGIYTVEGSQSGAAAASVWLSHRTIPLDTAGHGEILARCMFSSKRLYAELVTMADDSKDFVIVPVQRLPAEREGKSSSEIAAQRRLIAELIVGKSDKQLLEDEVAIRLLRELGSDLIIVAYMFNFKIDGVLNTDVKLVNELNTMIYNRFSLMPDKNRVKETPLLLNASRFDPLVYGRAFTDDLKRRLGVVDPDNKPLDFLISTTMNPMITDTEDGNFIPKLITVLKGGVLDLIGQIRARSATNRK